MITTNLNKPTTPRRHWFDLPVPAAAGIIIFAIYLIAGLVWQLRSVPRVAAVPTPGLIILIATSPAVIVPTAVPVQQVAAMVPENVTRRAIGVFGAPDTATYIGGVEAGRAFVPIGRYGSEWIQVDMQDSGRVFVRTADLYGVPDLADLKPTDAPVVVERQPVIVYQPAMAVATPTEQAYAVTNADPDFYSSIPDTADLDAVQSLIGSDPNALACGGSPLCGGLTNAQAQEVVNARRAARAAQP